MKIDKKETAEHIFWTGFEKGKKHILDKIYKFVEQESEFMADTHSDMLLDRLVKFIKKL